MLERQKAVTARDEVEDNLFMHYACMYARMWGIFTCSVIRSMDACCARRQLLSRRWCLNVYPKPFSFRLLITWTHLSSSFRKSIYCHDNWPTRTPPTLWCISIFICNTYATQGKWFPHEDQKLRQLVDVSGDNIQWSSIAREIKTRNARQCRERWNCYLNPDLMVSKY